MINGKQIFKKTKKRIKISSLLKYSPCNFLPQKCLDNSIHTYFSFSVRVLQRIFTLPSSPLCLDAFVVMGDNIYVIPKVKFHVLSESYKQLMSTERERSSSFLFSLLLLLLSAVPSHSELVKLFTEATLSLSWKKTILLFFSDNLLLNFWIVSVPRSSQKASELVVDKQESMPRSDVGTVGLPE